MINKKIKIKQLRFFPSPSFLKSSQEEFQSLLKNKILKKVILAVFYLLVLDIIIVIFLFPKMPPQIPLFYSRPIGKEQLANKRLFFFLPLICSLIILINFRLASFYYQKEAFLSKILIWTSVLIAILTNITLVKILIIIL